jgi:hypothetical protein
VQFAHLSITYHHHCAAPPTTTTHIGACCSAHALAEKHLGQQQTENMAF